MLQQRISKPRRRRTDEAAAPTSAPSSAVDVSAADDLLARIAALLEVE